MRFETDAPSTKKTLSETFLELVNTADSEKEISIISVAFKANVHRNTVYYHFSDMRELVLWTIHETISAPHECSDRDFICEYITRNKKLLNFAKSVLGTDGFIEKMRYEMIPILEKLCYDVPNVETKTYVVESFAEQIIVAFMLQEKPYNAIAMIFDYIVPEMKKHSVV